MSVIRSFGLQTVKGSSSQPLFYTTLSADGSLTPDQFTGNTNPGSNPSLSYLPVTQALPGFRVGDLVAVAPKGNFVYPYNNIDTGQIKAITLGTPYDIITVQGLLRSHASGEYLLLNEPASIVKIVPRVTTGLLYIGNGSDVAANAQSLIDAIPIYGGTGAVPYFHLSEVGDRSNPFQLMEYWVIGTTNDTFVAYWTEV